MIVRNNFLELKVLPIVWVKRALFLFGFWRRGKLLEIVIYACTAYACTDEVQREI